MIYGSATSLINTELQVGLLHGNLLMLVGLMASWASWAFFTLFKYFLISSGAYCFPYLEQILVSKNGSPRWHTDKQEGNMLNSQDTDSLKLASKE